MGFFDKLAVQFAANSGQLWEVSIAKSSPVTKTIQNSPGSFAVAG